MFHSSKYLSSIVCNRQKQNYLSVLYKKQSSTIFDIPILIRLPNKCIKNMTCLIRKFRITFITLAINISPATNYVSRLRFRQFSRLTLFRQLSSVGVYIDPPTTCFNKTFLRASYSTMTPLSLNSLLPKVSFFQNLSMSPQTFFQFAPTIQNQISSSQPTRNHITPLFPFPFLMTPITLYFLHFAPSGTTALPTQMVFPVPSQILLFEL